MDITCSICGQDAEYITTKVDHLGRNVCESCATKAATIAVTRIKDSPWRIASERIGMYEGHVEGYVGEYHFEIGVGYSNTFEQMRQTLIDTCHKLFGNTIIIEETE